MADLGSPALLDTAPLPGLGPLVIDLRDEVLGAPADHVRQDGLVSLAVLMAAYNEEATILRAVNEVLSLDYPCPVQLIVVDDGSTDATLELLGTVEDPRLQVIRHPVNRGKGAALRTAAKAARASHVVPFDADLEYSALDLLKLLEPVMEGRADIVYGTRAANGHVRHRYTIYALGNAVMTAATNMLFGSAITDLHTCLKLVPLELMRSLPLTQDGFGLDTELTAWLLRLGLPLCEVPVTYEGRSRAEGKKITWRDSLTCLHLLGWVRLAPAISPSRVELRQT